MTSWKGAAALGVVLVALAVYAFTTRPGAHPASPVRLFDCVPGQAVEFSITATDGRVTDARRDAPGSPWRLVAPRSEAANGTAVDDLVFNAYSISAASTVSPAPPDSRVGLDKPYLVVACALSGGRSYTLSIGGQNFDASGYYARVGGGKLYVIPSAPVVKFGAALDKPPAAASPSPSGSPSPSPST